MVPSAHAYKLMCGHDSSVCEIRREVLESEHSCKLTELFSRISETMHAKETQVLTDQTDSDAAVETHPAVKKKQASLQESAPFHPCSRYTASYKILEAVDQITQ